MCKNAQTTAVNLMTAIEPTLKSLIALTGLDGTLIFTEYDDALAAIKGWAPGTTAETVLEVLDALDKGFNDLPVPDEFKTLANIILAGIATVIGVIKANSPAPPSPLEPSEATAPQETIQAHHQAVVAADTAAKVQALVPGFKRSIWHSPESQYKSAWDKAVDEGHFPETLKV